MELYGMRKDPAEMCVLSVGKSSNFYGSFMDIYRALKMAWQWIALVPLCLLENEMNLLLFKSLINLIIVYWHKTLCTFWHINRPGIKVDVTFKFTATIYIPIMNVNIHRTAHAPSALVVAEAGTLHSGHSLPLWQALLSHYLNINCWADVASNKI